MIHKLLCVGAAFMLLSIGGCIGPLPVTSGPAGQSATPQPIDAASAAGSSECLQSYDPAIDYFPEKAVVSYASGFTIEYFKHYKLLTVQTPFPGGETQQYVLVHCGAPAPKGYAASQIIVTPVKRIITMSTTFLTPLDELGLLDHLVGLDEATYISNPHVLKLAEEGRLGMVGVGAGVDIEQVIDLQPDLIMTASTGNSEFDAHPKLLDAGLKVVINAEWQEPSPLGRAEWSKFIAAFFNREAIAGRLFAERVQQYQELAALASTATARPTVFTNTMSRGIWSTPGGNSYIARFLADAGTNYLWAAEITNERLQLSFEEVYDRAGDADFWVNTGRNATTLAELLAEDARYADFRAVQNGNVWNNNARTGPGGGNVYWEVGVAHPEEILADLIKIFHPELLPAHEFIYYHRLK